MKRSPKQILRRVVRSRFGSQTRILEVFRDLEYRLKQPYAWLEEGGVFEEVYQRALTDVLASALLRFPELIPKAKELYNGLFQSTLHHRFPVDGWFLLTQWTSVPWVLPDVSRVPEAVFRTFQEESLEAATSLSAFGDIFWMIGCYLACLPGGIQKMIRDYPMELLRWSDRCLHHLVQGDHETMEPIAHALLGALERDEKHEFQMLFDLVAMQESSFVSFHDGRFVLTKMIEPFIGWFRGQSRAGYYWVSGRRPCAIVKLRDRAIDWLSDTRNIYIPLGFRILLLERLQQDVRTTQRLRLWTVFLVISIMIAFLILPVHGQTYLSPRWA
jgi:hypothetical protein